ncbi:MAG TPA: metal-dependent transcriptional regulator [Propionibacteriaceae bacterium]|nr:metal-dependent transcriptional regulator [Propionibacteriaceae bacterium]
MEVEELTSVAQDYLKVIWSATEWGDPPITTTGLARRFDTTSANVSVTLRRLEGQGLLSYQPYRPAELTELGQRLALAMVRRHRLLETFLATELGYAWDEVHDEAERLEHAVSEELLARIDHRLGFPLVDPHGDTIPRTDGTLAPRVVALSLSQALPGSYRVVRVSDADSVVLAKLAALGVVPGAEIDWYLDPPGIGVGGRFHELTSTILAAIRVAA